MKIKEVLSRPLDGYSALVVLIACLSLVAAGLLIDFKLNRISEKKFCAIAQSNYEVFQETPPPTETGRNAAKNWEYLLRALNCPPGNSQQKDTIK